MAKSKAPKRSVQASAQAPANAANAPLRYAAIAIVGLAIAGGFWWLVSGGEQFRQLARDGAPALERMTTEPSLGREHLSPGATYAYPSRFPTSGPHDPNWVKAGFYAAPQPPTQIVHALEHGNIVIYYDKPKTAALDTMKDWAVRFSGQWDGVVVVPMAGLGERVVLTAWTRRLELDQFEPASAAAFVDAFRGRGPENPVR
ncbi:MAG TPA: DUF3105 domain-containing protein [Alphaproteobacteria bacterium]|nr:DUF3105 domain-containing protein [Alphaproteobacteria bacterium]